jgi:hypothetical protein
MIFSNAPGWGVKRQVKRQVKRRVHMCMYVYVLHVCNVIHTDTYTYMYIHANTYTYIHIHTPNNQCHEGVLGCCCCRTRLLCAAPPTQICSDGAQDGIYMQPLRVEGPWAAQGGCVCPPPTRAARTSAPKWVRGWVPDLGIKWQGCCPWPSGVGLDGCRPPPGMFRACCGHRHINEYMWAVCGLHMYTCIHMYANTYIYMHIHTYTCNDLGQVYLMNTVYRCRYTQDTYRYIPIHADTYTYIHIQPPTISAGRDFCGAAAHERDPYAECYLPRSAQDGAQDGLVECPLRVEGPWAAQGGCLSPFRRVQRAQVRQNGSGGGSLISG